MKRTFTVKPKQNIRASYIPDMTERYPEGMDTRGYDPYLDDPDAPLITLRDRIEDMYDALSYVLFVAKRYDASDIWKIEEVEE